MSNVNSRQRVGIYAGTFNPVHAGHVAFALQAIEAAQLDEVVFLPERRPRYKTDVEHFGHRVAMLSRAARPHKKLSVLELVDANFSVRRTLPQLRRRFPGATLVFLFGSDVLDHLPQWDSVDQLVAGSELLIGVRSGEQLGSVQTRIARLPVTPLQSHVVESHAPHVSSGKIREALRRRASEDGILASVDRYARQHWLYVSLKSV